MGMKVVILVTMASVAGCLGATDDDTGSPLPVEENIWQNGLAHFYETPAHVQTRDAAHRLADLASPGDAGFAQFDAVMEAFVVAEEVPAAQLAIMHEGRLIYASGYGYTKPDGTGPTTTDHMFRIASVTKPITHALISLQVEQGLYNWTDPVFCLPPAPASNCRLPIAPHPDHPVIDGRIANITVEDLVAHKGGWGRSTDYVYRSEGTEAIWEALNTTDPPALWQGAQFLMGLELEDDPGTEESYCNMCYNLAALVAEAATGAQFGALLDAYLFRPLGIAGEIEIGKAFPEDRNPREPFYYSDRERASAYDPDKMVPAPDGSFNIEMLAGSGGIVATAAAVAAVYEAYPELIPGWTPLAVQGVDPYGGLDLRDHDGLLDGTLAESAWAEDLDGPGGVFQFVFLLNSGTPSRPCVERELPQDLHEETAGCGVDALKLQLLNLAMIKARERNLA